MVSSCVLVVFYPSWGVIAAPVLEDTAALLCRPSLESELHAAWPRGRIDRPVQRVMTAAYCFGSTRQPFAMQPPSTAVASPKQPPDDGLKQSIGQEPMPLYQFQYLPLSGPSLLVLVAAFILVVVLIQLGVLRYAYLQLGVSSGIALLLLFGSLVGSYFNIPLAQLPERQTISGQEISYFGMIYVVPAVVEWPGTVIAANVGGAVIPTLMSVYLLLKHKCWQRGLIATGIVAAVCYSLAHPMPGIGIAEPVFVPALTAAATALLLGGEQAASLAYVSGSLGTLIGADLLNLGRIQGLGAPIASIGGAGTFDGIFLIGIFAVLIASFARPSSPQSQQRRA